MSLITNVNLSELQTPEFEEAFLILDQSLVIKELKKKVFDYAPLFYKREPIAGESILNFVADERIEVLTAVYQRVLKGEEITYEVNFLTNDKKEIIFRNYIKPIRDTENKITGITILASNITHAVQRQSLLKNNDTHIKEWSIEASLENLIDSRERKSINKEFTATDSHWSLIYNTVTYVIFMLEVEDREQYKLISINDSLFRVTGIQKEEILNKYLHDIISPSFLAFTRKKLRETVERFSTTSWEDTVSFHGKVKHFLVTVTPVANKNSIKLIGSFHDITGQKNEQQQLKLLESIAMNTNDVIMITSAGPLEKPGPHIMYINEAFTKLTGYKPNEVLGKSPRLLQGEKTDKKDLERLSESLHKYESCKLELINYRKNGEEYWVDLYVSPLKDDSGFCTHWIAFERDITNRKRQELEKEKLLDELIRSNKELKQFSYITSHNLRGPLTNLISIANFLDTQHINDPVTVNLIEGFKTSTYQLNQTLDDLIKILIIKETARQEYENIYFETTYNSLLASLSFLIKDSEISITTDFSRAKFVPFNKVYMESIFINLITNAIKYHHPHRTSELKISSFIKDHKVQLVFEDNGIGFDLEKIKGRVFGLYQRFHTHAEGRGLGLYLIQSQINAAGGSIVLESTLNKGSKFTIAFK